MKVNIIEQSSDKPALLGLGLSYGITSSLNINELSAETLLKLRKVASTLYQKNNGHNKFLESLTVHIDITAPRYWWQQFDTYRIGVTKQSESTMHTLYTRPMLQTDFEEIIPDEFLQHINYLISQREFDQLKNILPEGFLQRRIVCTNYKVLRHIIYQREMHKLKQWKIFIAAVLSQISYPYLNY